MRELRLRSVCLRLISISCLFLITSSLMGQKQITVLDDTGTALIGVEIFNKDYAFASVTDEAGKVEIPKAFVFEKLTLKYLGFETQIVDLSSFPDASIFVRMQSKQELLEEVLLVGRSDIRSRDFLQKVDAVQSRDIAASNPQTTADALSRYSEVYIQKSQMGGGSPVIRGFEANKVLLVLDGVRMNNAIYRNGHLQNAITVDQAILDQMEIIYGPSSLMYGSDALGGVVHFRTKDPILNLGEYDKVKVKGNYYARYASANQEKSGHVDFNIGGKKWGSLTSLSYADYGDLRMGSRRTTAYPDFGKRLEYQERVDGEDIVSINDDFNRQVGTAYNQFDLLQKIKYQINDEMNLTANIQYSTSTNIPRYDQLILTDSSGFQFAEWNYGPQDRSLLSLKYKWSSTRPWMDELIVIASRQDIEESRIERPFGSSVRATRIENVDVNALTIDFKKSFDKERNHTIYYGLDFNQNKVNSEAENLDLLSGETNNDLFTRYPSGGSNMNLFGSYLQYINQSPDSVFVFHGGVRYSTFSTSLQYLRSDPIQWPGYFYDGIDANNAAFTWSGGINWQPKGGWTIRFLAASAFRAPNIDDIGKLRVKNENITVPNPDLGSERSLNTEINISKRFGNNFVLAGSFFYTRLSGAIIRTNFMLPDGSSTFQEGGRTYNIEGNVNAEEAQIAGISFNLKAKVLPGLLLNSSINYIRGQLLDAEQSPLGHIPPTYGRTELKYLWNNWSISILSLYNGSKPLEDFGGSVDNPEYATPIGSLGWTIYNTYVDYKFKQHTFQVGVENIFDKHYRPFASGVSGAGINAIVAVRSSF